MKTGCRGMTLVECSAALALIGLAVVGSGAALNIEARASVRLESERSLIRAIEYTLETVRASGEALVVGTTETPAPAGMQTAQRPITVRTTVSRESRAGLYRVSVEARCPVLGKPLVRRIETLVWRTP